MEQLAGIVAATVASGVAWGGVIAVAGAQTASTSSGQAYPAKPTGWSCGLHSGEIWIW